MNSKLSSGILMLCVGLLFDAIIFIMSVEFNQQCAGYLKQAADANTVELAMQRLDKALEYIEAHNLTDGYTSVFYKTEDDNIGYWYQNIKACQKELKEGADGSQLEKSNLLLKVRESLTDNTENSTEVTLPGGIAYYPNNALLGFINILGWILIFFGIRNIIYRNS